MSGGLVVRLPFDPGVELVPVDAGAVSHGNAERRPIGTFVVLITVARPCGVLLQCLFDRFGSVFP